MKNFFNRIKYKFYLNLYKNFNKKLFKSFSKQNKFTFSIENINKNIEKYGFLECNIKGKKIKVPLKNEFGYCYPCSDTKNVDKLFDIKKNDIVVDIGGGANPLKRANIVVDLYPDYTKHRDKNKSKIKLYPHQKFIQGNIEDLSKIFKDKSIDFVFTQQTLEHLNHPEKACKEMIRIGKRGFIDVPRCSAEINLGHPEHKWFINYIDDTLIFRKKPIINFGSPFLGIYPLNSYWFDNDVSLLLAYYYRNVSCIQLLWENDFKFKITKW